MCGDEEFGGWVLVEKERSVTPELNPVTIQPGFRSTHINKNLSGFSIIVIISIIVITPNTNEKTLVYILL